MSEPRPADATTARPWQPADGPIRTRAWGPREQPWLQVRAEETWCPARLTMREDRQNGRVIYHVLITLPSNPVGVVHRAYWWDPAMIRPAE
jgi:hypothetical protein